MKLSILSTLPLLSLPLTALAAPDLAGLVGWAADKLVDGEVRTMDSWNYVDCGELRRISCLAHKLHRFVCLYTDHPD